MLLVLLWLSIIGWLSELFVVVVFVVRVGVDVDDDGIPFMSRAPDTGLCTIRYVFNARNVAKKVCLQHSDCCKDVANNAFFATLLA